LPPPLCCRKHLPGLHSLNFVIQVESVRPGRALRRDRKTFPVARIGPATARWVKASKEYLEKPGYTFRS
jgi:hypothetical protein